MGSVVLALAGCGGTTTTTPAAQHLEREDLAVVTSALRRVEPSVERELAASKSAWPQVANGLPTDPATIPRAPITNAVRASAAVQLPVTFELPDSAALTGPGSQLASLFRSFNFLASRGWSLIAAAIAEIEHGSPAAARFARANVPLYIDSVYDGHFDLAQIGKQLLTGYGKLGGANGFGGALTQPQVAALAGFYSEANARLHPHAGVKLGS